jgi:hypothetical protein
MIIFLQLINLQVVSERRGSVLQYLSGSLGLLSERFEDGRARLISVSKDSFDSDSEEDSIDNSESNQTILSNEFNDSKKRNNSLGNDNLMNTVVSFNKMPLDSKRLSPIVGERKTIDKVQAGFRPNSGNIKRADIDEIVNQEDKPIVGRSPISSLISLSSLRRSSYNSHDEVVNQEDKSIKERSPSSSLISLSSLRRSSYNSHDEVVNQEENL